jgi:hypothetical protein
VRGYVPQSLIEWAELNTCSARIKNSHTKNLAHEKLAQKNLLKKPPRFGFFVGFISTGVSKFLPLAVRLYVFFTP